MKEQSQLKSTPITLTPIHSTLEPTPEKASDCLQSPSSAHLLESPTEPKEHRTPTMSTTCFDSTTVIPNLSTCLDISYEERDYIPGVKFTQTSDDQECGWTPVKKRRVRSSARKVESESDSDVDVSCSRLVQYEEHDGISGLKIFRRGPPTWTPIKPTSPVASRTRSKTTNI